ncbi:uncharacterized protein MAM_04356 [Metarhizium album ARSEF 1941]|uniref:NAD dependent epimerase/dehydratase n=1 Tax=Metarhizium album (strain ARSEF 1941) TaxID=1081103 RepID=A0A0B2WX06_METAS|nr:uncharacterized protein MAM_04356 [Metarhizium album ARSEF 1941]KHN97967.1 hypothetical protein MAM_04356 [Metarhizium album ARSEF 1941]
MSRIIDNFPQPKTKAQVKVIVATASRTGTLSVYEAMNILGYKTYHMRECLRKGGLPHMEILMEAVEAQHHHGSSGIKRYSRQDFDKWLAEYDCLVEIPFFIGSGLLEAYADDPNIKFILTDRDPDKWVTSINKTTGEIVINEARFPLNVLKYFNRELHGFLALNKALYGKFAQDTLPGDRDNRAAVRKNYVSYIEMAKRVLPADRLLYFHLEDGLGWEQICPFLGLPIPDQPFPVPHSQENFKRGIDGWMKPRIQSAMMKLAAVVVPVAGSLAYFGIKYGPWFAFRLGLSGCIMNVGGEAAYTAAEDEM